MRKLCWTLVVGSALLPAGAGWAATLVVNSLVDTVAPDDGLCTLREAITAANANTASGGVAGECVAGAATPVRDAIVFSVAGAIQPTSPLPIVTELLLVNGFGDTTNPEAPCPSYLPVPTIELDGTNAGGVGLKIIAGASIVRGLTINRFPSSAMSLSGGGGNRLQCSLIGTDPTGTIDRGNTFGIGLSSEGNLIGSDGDGVNDANEGNLISGNGHSAVFVLESSHNRISGNRIGTTADGSAVLGTSSVGVRITDATENIVGTNGDGVSDEVEGNLISGNGSQGIQVSGGAMQLNRISGNRIGTNASGTAAIANHEWGIYILHSGGNVIGTNGDGSADAFEGNLISGNTPHGILLGGIETQQTRIAGNRIGTDATGTYAIPNTWHGVWITMQANHNIVGTDGNGVADEDEGNLISGNQFDGVNLAGEESPLVWPPFSNRISGNRIGTSADGLAALPNQGAGVFVGAGASNTTVGSNGDGISDPVEGNVIAFNGSNGVTVKNGLYAGKVTQTVRATASRNSIFSNTALGLDLGSDGVTWNDAGDGDHGANELQNFPEIESATVGGGSLLIVYTVSSPPPLAIEFFLSDADGEEGETYLGSAIFPGGEVAMANMPAGPTTPGSLVVANATDADGNTSEFSFAATVEAGNSNAIFGDGFESGNLQAWGGCAGCR